MQIHLIQALFPGSLSWNRLILPCYYTKLRLILLLTLGLFSSIFKKRCRKTYPAYLTQVKVQKEHLATCPAILTT